ncbi:MAG: hypothetical protein OEY44_05080 [Candidatus Peregrinibacteria bacterium]|nr:hypothetical protein [Candidatus Peregrinibacteria bacterium]
MKDLLEKYKDHVVPAKTQQQLNEPLKDQTGFNAGHEDFLKNLITKLESGELDPHNIETLYNRAVYDKLSEGEQEQTSLTAVNLMSFIRQIQQLWQIDQSATFQIQNLVENVFQMKSKFEEKHGDVYII